MLSPQKILIPTDFRVTSLNALRLALERIDAPRVNVVLLHCQTLDDSITELLFYSPKRIVYDLLTDDFRDGISILRNHYEYKFGTLQIELFHGHAQSAFDTLLDTLGIDAIYVLNAYRLHPAPRAFDAMPYIRKSLLPCYELAWDRQHSIPQEDKLENLFW